MKKALCIIFVSACYSISTGTNAQEADVLFLNKQSQFCGVEVCETNVIFNTCSHPDCGSATEDCGTHWTGWHSCGGGHGNPCPSGCSRTGGALGYSYRSVGFPPRCQERNKYQCLRNINRTCQIEACGVASRPQTGAISAYFSCEHPANGLNIAVWETLYNNSSREMQSLLDFAKMTTELFEEEGDQDFSHSLNQTVLVLQQYLNLAYLFPGDHQERLESLSGKIESAGSEVTLTDLREILGSRIIDSLQARIPERQYSCDKTQ